jgi:3-hydroxyisobutyrate dehydrogenase-like beta-hydroxyacid dehydrogenase
VADAAELVMASLPTPEIVRAVALGPDGVAAGGRVRTFLDLSTSGPRTIAAIAESLAAKGIATVDCPVSGGVGGAERGTLAVMVAAPRPLFEEVAELLTAIGKVFHVGDRPGMGQTMKLANNLLSAAAMAVTSEAMVMGVKAGLDPQVMLDVINAGSGRNTATQDKFPRAILTRSFDYGFTTGLMYKDVRLCLDEAENLQVPMWVASAVRQLWFLAQSQIGAEKDFTTIVQCVENWAGVEVRQR